MVTFSMVYAYHEHFVLLSHDEVVHEKGSLIEKYPATRGEVRQCPDVPAWMWAHPGKLILGH
jgi:1,4-alpha-glucan branching enzyme